MNKKSIHVRGVEIGAGIPKIAVPLVARSLESLRKALEGALAVPADLFEYRADYDPEAMRGGSALQERLQLVRDMAGEKPVLFTIRTAAEGGEADISFQEYSRLNHEAAGSGLVDLVDVELFTAAQGTGDSIREWVRTLKGEGVYVIGSSHDFEKTPDSSELLLRVRAMQEAGMDITKLAVMPRSRRDVLSLLETAVRIDEEVGDRPSITMSMGGAGALSRIAGSFTGSAVTFGTAGNASAPGQIPAAALQQILKVLAD